MRLNEFDKGFVVGLLIGEGHFATSKNEDPVIAIKMHVRSRRTLERVQRLLGGSVYGPYQSGGRVFYIWKIDRRQALERVINDLYNWRFHEIDDHVGARFLELRARLRPHSDQLHLFGEKEDA